MQKDKRNVDRYIQSIYRSRLMQSIIKMKILLTILIVSAICQSNGTESYFLSPHGLGKTPEVENALKVIEPKIKVAQTSLSWNGNDYKISNCTVGLTYNDGRQSIQITELERVRVKDGKVQFAYIFNYTRTGPNGNIKGTAYGSVYSDSLMYVKELKPNQNGYIEWEMAVNGYTPITISSSLKIKRLEPSTADDLTALEAMLNGTVPNVNPFSVKTQLITSFNSLFPSELNNSLNSEVFGQNIDYEFLSGSHGPIRMTITHSLYNVSVTPQQGYYILFMTWISGWDKPLCNTTVPTSHFDYKSYGGSQNFHLNCIYSSVLEWLQSKGYLDTKLDEKWQCNAFQFFAGDLFDILPSLYLDASPLSVVEGDCTALKEGLSLQMARDFNTNEYLINIVYSCNAKTQSKSNTALSVLQFKLKARLYVQVNALTHTLEFKATSADVLSIEFTPVGKYFVSNTNLALFKAVSIIRGITNTTVFGNGFPTIVRDLPRTKVDRDFVLYYDVSHVEAMQS